MVINILEYMYIHNRKMIRWNIIHNFPTHILLFENFLTFLFFFVLIWMKGNVIENEENYFEIICFWNWITGKNIVKEVVRVHETIKAQLLMFIL